MAAILTGVLGVILLGTGMGIIALAYPRYNHTLKKERKKITPEILHLSEDLMQ